MKKYLFFVTFPYSFAILRPLQAEIWRRGDEVVWFFENSQDSKYIEENERYLSSIKEIIEYNPVAVFVAGNRVYDFIPGVKVQLFHGLIRKRFDTDDHFRIRGYFDLYCTVGNESTPPYLEAEQKHRYFKVVETGWSKLDDMIQPEKTENKKPVILYSSTFTKKLTSTIHLYDTIEALIKEKDWEWLITLHPKLDEDTIAKYKQLEKYANVSFKDTVESVSLMKKADVMLSDSSSIVAEFLWLLKPVVTFKNNNPGDYLIDIDDPSLVGESLEQALAYPPELMSRIKAYVDWIHPYRDGKSSARILDATDDFIKNYQGKLKRKPLILYRKLKLRKKAGYFPFGPRYKINKSEI